MGIWNRFVWKMLMWPTAQAKFYQVAFALKRLDTPPSKQSII